MPRPPRPQVRARHRMSEPTDESQDWPLRDYSQRLRPPAPTEEPLFEEPELPPPSASEPEILYDEDELEEDPEALVEVEEHAVPVEAPPTEEPPTEEPPTEEPPTEEPPAEEPPAEEPALPEEHAAGDFRVPDGYQ